VAQGNTVDELQSGGFFFIEDQRSFEETRPLRLSYYTPPTDTKSQPVPMWTQLAWLLIREVTTIKRHPGPMTIELLSNTVMGVITGITYFRVGIFSPDDISV
jgi:hypothetical protein